MTAPASDPAGGRWRDFVACAAAGEAFANESESGDRCVIQPFEDSILIAAIDGTGHGAEAAAAAKIAAATLEAYAGETPIALVLRCHEQLKGTRGAVMTIAFVHFSHRTLTWLAVGNVEGILFHSGSHTPPDRALLRSGVIGYRLPPLQVDVVPLKPRDTLILATDGITPDFGEEISLIDDPQAIADGILANYHSGADDALVVVARYLGGGL
jgi:phosphoserine phosphatase RsbX